MFLVAANRNMDEGKVMIKNKIHTLYPSFTKSEQKVANAILQHGKQTIYFSVTELAEAADVGEATILRFCRKLGYKGYQEFKLTLAKEPSDEAGHGGEEKSDVIQRLLHGYAESLEDSSRFLNREVLTAAVNALFRARSVHIFGTGLSGVTAVDMKYRFWMARKHADAATDYHAQRMTAGALTEGDVVIAISITGNETEMAQALQEAKRNGAIILAITHYADSVVTQAADYVLFTTGAETFAGAKLSQLFIADCLCEGIALQEKESSDNG